MKILLGYPLDLQDAVAQAVLPQAEALSSEWSTGRGSGCG